ncbi:MAG TPA: MATE family efflux transporter [Candidatus Atribacteria bacterium]|nr:MATE family efflux transporter [Candidatus Atribacteria bacterium]
MKKVTQDLTEGNIIKKVFSIALPMMAGNLFQMVYSLVDMFWVGKVSKEAIAAVSFSFALIFILISLAGGLGVASSIMTAQYFGARDHKRLKMTISVALWFIGGFALLLSIIGFLFSKTFLTWLHPAPDVFPLANAYFRIIMSGVPFMFLFFILSGILRGLGNAVIPMKVGLVSNLINIILDPILIFGLFTFPKLGVIGAAYATVFSRIIASSYLVYRLFKGKFGFSFTLGDLKADFEIIRHLLRIGIPSSLTHLFVSLGRSILMRIVAQFGTATVAAYGIGGRLDSAFFMIFMGLGSGVSAFVGQNIGRGKIHRVKTGVVKIGLITALISTTLAIIVFLSAKYLILIFSTEPDVVREGVIYLRTLAFFYMFIGVQFTIGRAFQGTGDAITTMFLSGTSVVLRITFAYILSRYIGVKGVWLGLGMSWIITSSIGFFLFLSERWKKKGIVKERYS